MALLTPYSGGGSFVRPRVTNTLTASDTFVYTAGTGQVLFLRNTTAGPLTVTLTGSGAVTRQYPGGGVVNFAAGYSTGVIPATTGDVEIPLDSISEFLAGTITVTGGTGITAALRNA